MYVAEQNSLLVYILLLLGSGIALYMGYINSGKKAKIACLNIAFPAVVFSHICYSLVNIEAIIYDSNWLSIISFWEKGYMLYGIILGVVFAVYFTSSKDFGGFLDAFVAPTALFIAIFRIAEGFIGQGYGEYWEGENGFFTRFPFMVFDRSYEQWAWAIFVLEALIAIIIFVIILKNKALFAGESFTLMIGLYAAFQIVLESLRRDEFLRFGFVRIEQVISAFVVLLVLIIYSVKLGKNKQKLPIFLFYIVFIVSAVLIEFAMEGRVEFLLFLNEAACYALLALIAVLFAFMIGYMKHIVAIKTHKH